MADENKLDLEILDRIEADEQARVGSGWLPDGGENPYRHIEEANEENYTAEDNK